MRAEREVLSRGEENRGAGDRRREERRGERRS